MEHTKLAVIIPTLNAVSCLERLIKTLRNQDQPITEILIVDSGSADGTIDLAISIQLRVITIESGSFDHGATRNLAAAETDADIMVYMTQDALPCDKKTLSHLVEPLGDKNIIISYARQIAGPQASLSEKYLRLANYPPVSQVKAKNDIADMGIKAFQNSNVCAAYRRKEFDALGRFPEPAVCNEDMIIAARAIYAGYRVAYSAEAKVWHTHDLSSSALFKRYFDIAASLDYEPRIRQFGRAEASGLLFLKNQLRYLREEKQLRVLPRVILETTAKYLGYKCGLNHNLIPAGVKEHMGMNKGYWRKVAHLN